MRRKKEGKDGRTEGRRDVLLLLPLLYVVYHCSGDATGEKAKKRPGTCNKKRRGRPSEFLYFIPPDGELARRGNYSPQWPSERARTIEAAELS